MGTLLRRAVSDTSLECLVGREEQSGHMAKWVKTVLGTFGKDYHLFQGFFRVLLGVLPGLCFLCVFAFLALLKGLYLWISFFLLLGFLSKSFAHRFFIGQESPSCFCFSCFPWMSNFTLYCVAEVCEYGAAVQFISFDPFVIVLYTWCFHL